MRLSEAIALGRTLCVSVPFKQDDGEGGGCALGMAARAVGKERMYGLQQIFECDFKVIGQPCASPCGCGIDNWFSQTVGESITHVFNKHVHGDKTWTLDQLIDWVRSVEPAETQAQPEPSTELLTCARTGRCS
jgi:hypothetical protein